MNQTASQSITIVVSKTGSRTSWIRNVLVDTPTAAELALAPPGVPTNRTRVGGVVSFNGENLSIDGLAVLDCRQGITVTSMANFTRCSGCDISYRDSPYLMRCGMSNVFEHSRRTFLGNGYLNGLQYVGWQPGFLWGEYCGTSMSRDVVIRNVMSNSTDRT
jgi:hypothetical protein